MDERFVPLREWLRPADRASRDELREREPEPASCPAEDTFPEEDERDDALAEVRRFRAALADALDAVLADLLAAIARDVLARELALAPADLAAIAARARERCAGDDPLALRVHPDACAALANAEMRVVPDERVGRDDVVLHVRCGTIDATLEARLDRVLARFGAA
ncbi:MAG: hypothetical protein KGN02_05665 [bacterium]|nr:hypothetical protein [bacterium]